MSAGVHGAAAPAPAPAASATAASATTTSPGPGLPRGLRAIGSSPEFTATTVPPALLQRHATAAGCWAELVVSFGELAYTDLTSGIELRLARGQRVAIPPTLPHRVTIGGPVAFRLHFYKEPG